MTSSDTDPRLEPVLDRIDQQMDAALERLQALIRIPSISTDPAHKADCQQAAEWLAEELRGIGFEDAAPRPTPGHPMVMGTAGTGERHLLFYGHYDVQPVDPLDLWDRPPFEPEIKDGPRGKIITGRGSSDDKGQLMTFVEACRAWVAVHGSLPVKVTMFFEGEEESGSPSLIPFLEENREALTADVAMICDTDLFQGERPAITTMLRGLLGEEVTITGPNRDLHSGMFGGAVINPIRVLSKVIAGLHDDEGRITVPGFYDGVPEVPEHIAAQWAELGFREAEFLGDVGVSVPAGEQDRSALEMLWSRPTCEVNGISGGYEGAGFKTVLPSKASAKISFRLVGDQDPHAIRENFRAYVQSVLPADCSVSFAEHGASKASVMSTQNPAFELARQALSDEWPKEAAFTGTGGSIPVAGYFNTILGMDAMLIGFAREDNLIHSPNEKYDLDSFQHGVRSWARILAALSRES